MINNLHIAKIASTFIARWKSLLGITGILLLSLLVVSCAEAGGGGTDTFAVGGTVSGLAENEDITLTLTPDSGTAEEEKVTGDNNPNTDDNFSFDTKLAKDAKYTITSTSPAGKACTVDPATEQTMGDADVSTVKVTCNPKTTEAGTLTVGGTTTGQVNEYVLNLAYGGESEDLTIAGDATEFTFVAKLAEGDTYTVSVKTQPQGHTCTVSPAGEQDMGEGDVTDVAVTCVADTYSVGGAVSGLAESEEITLTLIPDSGTAEEEKVTGDNNPNTDDPFIFDTKLAKDDKYTITTTSPDGKTCSVVPATEQTIGEANVTNVAVTCVANTYSVNVQVSGLADNEVITLTLAPTDGTDEQKPFSGVNDVDTVDSFTFDTKLAENATYTVSVDDSPAGKKCTVATANEGLQTMGQADATITVSCEVIPTYSVNFSVTNMADGDIIIMILTYGDENTTELERFTAANVVNGRAEFTFDTKLASGTSYLVSVDLPPVGKGCSSSTIPRTMGDSDTDPNDIVVSC